MNFKESINDNFNCSIVIPIFNEEETIRELWTHISKNISHLSGAFEIIFIDDGSVDKSFEIIEKLALEHPNIKVIRLSRNFGHQCALAAGIDYATGDSVILMDGDLQDTPDAIPHFINKWKEGYEVVYAVRQKRKESKLKRFFFWLFYRLIQITSGIKMPADSGIFSLMDRKVIDAIRSMPERNRYITGLRAYAGFNQVGIPVERGPRYRGEPRVTVGKLIKLALDGIISFSAIPLRMTTYLGIIFSLLSFCIGTIGIFYKFVLGKPFLSWPYGLTTTFFMGGVQLVFLGVLGEYISRIYDEVKQRPYYIVRSKINM
ncbi:MAG: glycosyltransferase family 2 protein [Cyanobacteria bacterium P01_C01_bin.118]